MTEHLSKRMKRFAPLALALPLLLLAGVLSSAQAARPFLNVNVLIDLTKGGEIVASKSSHSDPSAIKDKTFIELDLKVIIDETSSKNIQAIVDQGINADISGCKPGSYDPLDMEDGLRYFFQITYDGKTKKEQARATIYPGERSRNPYNDVFCEYDPKLGTTKAIFRVRGFFFVRHSTLPTGADIQIRPINPTPAEAETFLK